ncbi:hypothetical protein PIB30_051059 [Stylosanthes scabra]|uniref:PB1-like domain-containing protein n=1 Tax=Stylosanthes scabra TaxID=79078 RepID=A0ABU6SIH1_9FABA|nr:hypothetical protein [Stylosanthes scabra]
MDTIDVVYHHGGEFVTSKDGVLVYEMETIDVEEKIDVDTLDVFAMRNHYLALRYEKIEECWWLVSGRSLQTGRNKLKTDAELLELVFHAQRNGNEIHIYYEHAVSVPELAEECPKLIEMTPTPTQIPTESPTVIDLESSPQRNIPTMSTQPTQPHVTPTQNSNIDTINPTKSNSNNKPKSSKPVVTKQVKPNPKPSVKPTAKPTVKPTVKPTSMPNMPNMPNMKPTDEAYVPRADELWTDDEDEDEDEVRVTQAKKKDAIKRRGVAKDLKKAREEIMLEDDGLVADSDLDIDLGLHFGKDANAVGEEDEYHAYDADSDGKDSWESLKMKTPPNSEDEANEVVDDTPMFKEGVKFGEVRLEVGMRFKSKKDFMDAVREFTLQELGRWCSSGMKAIGVH